MIQSELSDFYTDAFKDKRIDARANLLLSKMITYRSAVINQCCSNHTQKIGAYRMLNNKNCNIDELCQALYSSCERSVKGKHLLCIQDTTEVSYFPHKDRIGKSDTNIGRLNDINVGYFCHPMLVVDAGTEMPIGFSSVKLWNRAWDKPKKGATDYKKLPIAEKESFRWISSVTESREHLPKDSLLTIIADRESDIYEALCTIPKENTHLLIRSSSNRVLCQDNIRLLDKMQSCEIRHTYIIDIKGNKSRKSRKASMDLRFTTVDIKRSAGTIGDYPNSVTMNCIYVVERPETVPTGESPIEWRLYTTHPVETIIFNFSSSAIRWRLYTTHPVETIEQAMQCVQWYRSRWCIEELFRLLKTDGLDIESSQLETGLALKKLMMFSLQAALQIMVMKIAYDKKREDYPAQMIFTEKQIHFLRILQPTLEGKTQKQKNPFTTDSLAWSAWIIARLGKWNGYSSQSPPGYITMKRGLDIFYTQFEAFIVTLKALIDVYKE